MPVTVGVRHHCCQKLIVCYSAFSSTHVRKQLPDYAHCSSRKNRCIRSPYKITSCPSGCTQVCKKSDGFCPLLPTECLGSCTPHTHTHTHTHTQVPCSTASEALERHKRAARMRQQACTGVNSTSSRSHCIFAVSDTQQRFLKRLFGLVLTVNFGGLECVKV